MAFVKTIYLPDSLRKNVDKVESLSNLVSILLEKHFRENCIDNDFETELKKIKSNKERILQELKDEENNLLYQKQVQDKIIEEKVLTEEKKKEKELNFILNVIQNAKELFNADITIDDVREYKEGDYQNLLDFLIYKGLVKDKEFR